MSGIPILAPQRDVESYQPDQSRSGHVPLEAGNKLLLELCAPTYGKRASTAKFGRKKGTTKKVIRDRMMRPAVPINTTAASTTGTTANSSQSASAISSLATPSATSSSSSSTSSPPPSFPSSTSSSPSYSSTSSSSFSSFAYLLFLPRLSLISEEYEFD